MEFTVALTKNYEFRRLYNKGKSSASKFVAIYCMKNYSPMNKLGITVSTKIGGAVERNRIRRRLKEIYRINEHILRKGFSIVIVARQRSKSANWDELQASVLYLFSKLNLADVDAPVNSKSIDRENATI